MVTGDVCVTVYFHYPMLPHERWGDDLFQLQRNHFSAITNERPPQMAMMANGTHCELRLAPCRMMARNASLSAGRGSALISGWVTCGERPYEKNTPEKIHMGIITRLMRPLTLSIFCAWLAVCCTTPPNDTAPNTATWRIGI